MIFIVIKLAPYINIEKDYALGCGKMLNNEVEFSKCSRCKCVNQLLTCSALSTPQCDRLITKNSKKYELKSLIKIMNQIELNAYKYYLNEYDVQLGYKIEYEDIQNDFEIHKNNPVQSNNNNKLIVFKTSDRIVGIYFPKLNQQIRYNNNANVLQFNFLLFFSLNLFYLF